tara:strand:- start:3087 stop:3407 length:321 start_codon:yes stop_codon:yes gene_type:complete
MGNKQPVPDHKYKSREQQLQIIQFFYTSINDSIGDKEWLKWKDDEEELDIFDILATLNVYVSTEDKDKELEELYLKLLRKYNRDKSENDKLTKSIKIEENEANLKF